jgi:hypothetical protein
MYYRNSNNNGNNGLGSTLKSVIDAYNSATVINSIRKNLAQLAVIKQAIESDVRFINNRRRTTFETRIKLITIMNESKSVMTTIEDISNVILNTNNYDRDDLDYACGFIDSSFNRLHDLYDMLQDLK